MGCSVPRESTQTVLVTWEAWAPLSPLGLVLLGASASPLEIVWVGGHPKASDPELVPPPRPPAQNPPVFLVS